MLFIEKFEPLKTSKDCKPGFYLIASSQLFQIRDESLTSKINKLLCGRLLFVWGGRLFKDFNELIPITDKSENT